MTLVDKKNNDISVSRNEAESRYEITYADAAKPAGFTEYLINDNDRIFYHTEIDDQFGGRGLASILVSEALKDTFPSGQVVVGLCPFVKGHVEKKGYDGAYRDGTKDDIAFIREMKR